MDPPPTDGRIERDNFEEVKEGGPMHHCNLFDAEVTHKMAEAFLPGLASACVDNTTGGLFNTPGSVAVQIRKEMVDELIQRSETFVAEAVLLEGEAETEVPEHPFYIISDFIDDYSSSKRNFFGRISDWLLSDRREDRIDDFVQEMEKNGFWMIDRREAVAQTLLKNVDFKDAFHCNKKFNSADELVEHLPQCRFRTVHCPNEGCDDQFSAGNSEIHDAVCPFKMLPCEQNCSDILMRRDMDKHCITDCPMKHVNCPFSSVGCESSIPRCKLEQHKAENIHGHVLGILKSIHKEAETEDLKHRVDQLEELSSAEQLAKAQNVRSLTTLIKNLEAQLGPLEVMQKTTSSEGIPSEKEEFTDIPEQEDEHMESSNTKEVRTQPPQEKLSVESSAVAEDVPDPPIKTEVHKEPSDIKSLSGNDLSSSRAKKEEFVDSPTKDRTRESPAKEEHPVQSSVVLKDLSDPPPSKTEEHNKSSDRKSPSANDSSTDQAKMEELMESTTKDNTRDSPAKEHPVESSAVARDLSDPPAKIDERKEPSDKKSLSGNDLSSSQAKKEELMDSPTKDNTRESSAKEEHPVQSSVVNDLSDPPTKTEEHNKSSDRTRESPAKEHPVELSSVAKDLSDPPTKIEEHKESSEKTSLSENDLSTGQEKKEEVKDSSTIDRTSESPAKEEHPVEPSALVKDLSDPPSESEEHKEPSEERLDKGTYSSTKEREHDESLVREDESKKEDQKTSTVQTE